MRLGKRERAALREKQAYALGNAARVARAGPPVRMRASLDAVNRIGFPTMGLRAVQWQWDWRKYLSVRALNSK